MKHKIYFFLASCNFLYAESFGQDFFLNIFPLVVMAIAVYLLLLKPQQQMQAHHKTMLENLKKGDKVILTSGIFGTVKKIDSENIKLEISDQIIITVEKNSVNRLNSIKK